MKRLIYLGFLLATGSALAQPLEEIIASETIGIRVQQTRTFTFSSPVKEIKLADAGVAAILPESDRTFNFRGLAQGQTLMTAYGQNGNVIYRANISVQQEFGYVKIYGLGRTKDFNGYYCTEAGCGRGDKDIPPTPLSTTVSESRPDGVTISREYR